MAVQPVRASLVWEDNPSTPLDAYNLSKTIDVQPEQKFVYYADDTADYQAWADITFESPATGLTPFAAAYSSSAYLGKVIYNRATHIAATVVSSVDNNGAATYNPVLYISPWHKLLKIKAKTKITMDFTSTKGETLYNSFDVGSADHVFSAESLITESDFLPNTIYHIYLYYHIAYGNYAQVKIMDLSEVAWMTTAADDASPSGYKLVSYRKIGGFKTDTSDNGGGVIPSSVWDLSTYKTEVVVDSLKKNDPAGIRPFKALDVPIDDANNILTSTDVENALQEVKARVDKVYGDTYTDNRFGYELKFSPFKISAGALVACITNDLTVKITAGFVDVYGERVLIANDVYFPNATVRLNTNPTPMTPFLGDPPASGALTTTVYDSSTTGDGTVWRVFIDILGRIILKENSVARPQYICQGKLKGWYDITNGARCVGKFKVRRSGFYFVEKLSVTSTVDRKVEPNTVVTFHGTMCPDGLIPCDGTWRDVNGIDQNGYPTMPALTDPHWAQGSWYEESPNMWGRTTKMPQSNQFSTGNFYIDQGGTHGGSADAGIVGGNETHTHAYAHSHRPGTIVINSSGAHSNDTQWIGAVSDTRWVQASAGFGVGVQVASEIHTHNLLVSGGPHTHAPTDFAGQVENLSTAQTGQTSSWAPYKEMLFCIKK